MPLDPSRRKMRSGLLAQSLVKRGHKVTWWASGFDHLSKTKVLRGDGLIELEPGLCLHYLSSLNYSKNISLRRYLDHLLYARKFAQVVRKAEAPDLIIANTPDYHLAYEGYKYAQSLQIPYIVDVRDPWPDSFIDMSSNAFIKKLLRILLHRDFEKVRQIISGAVGITSMMSSLLAWALEKRDSRKSFESKVFYLGAKSFGFSQADFEKRSGWGKKHPFTVAYIGSFGALQNPKIVIEAASIIERKHPELPIAFIVAGDGPMRSEVEKLAKKVNNLRLHGWVNNAEIKGILLQSHVGIIPENLKQDTFPNKTFTYMSGGLPLLAGSEGELREFILANSVGTTFNSKAPESLANEIIALYKNPIEWKNMQANALEIFDSQFNADRIYSEFANWIECVYEQRLGAVSSRVI